MWVFTLRITPCTLYSLFGPLAQSVEHLPFKQTSESDDPRL